jgi:hypothetical protein
MNRYSFFRITNFPDDGGGDFPNIESYLPIQILASRVQSDPVVQFERLFSVGGVVYSVRFWDASGKGDWFQGVRKY